MSKTNEGNLEERVFSTSDLQRVVTDGGLVNRFFMKLFRIRFSGKDKLRTDVAKKIITLDFADKPIGESQMLALCEELDIELKKLLPAMRDLSKYIDQQKTIASKLEKSTNGQLSK